MGTSNQLAPLELFNASCKPGTLLSSHNRQPASLQSPYNTQPASLQSPYNTQPASLQSPYNRQPGHCVAVFRRDITAEQLGQETYTRHDITARKPPPPPPDPGVGRLRGSAKTSWIDPAVKPVRSKTHWTMIQ